MTTIKKIIGVTGIAGSGKDTFALVAKEMEQKTDQFAFAGPLKDACKILFNFSHDQLHDQETKEIQDGRWKKSPREILQWLGTDVLRNQINEDFFVMNMKQRIDDSKAEYIIVTDVRFPNEAEFIRSLGGKVVKIVRDNKKTGGKTTKYSSHVTEQGIPDNLVDAIIENNSSIEEFKNNIRLVKTFLFNESNHSNHFT